MIFVTYKDNGENDISDVTSYFYNEEEAKEYAELMGQQYMAVPNIGKEYWPEKVKYVYCSAWPTSNNISTDIREYEILSDKIKDIKTELIVRPNSVCKCFFCPKEEAQEEFNNILNEYKAILRPNEYGCLQNQLVRKDLTGLLSKIVNEQECWGTQEDWDAYNTQIEANERAKSNTMPSMLTSGGFWNANPLNYATVAAGTPTGGHALNIRSTPYTNALVNGRIQPPSNIYWSAANPFATEFNSQLEIRETR